ncbi:MAG: RluA family pseudouridine synthase [Deltaproteobacteria bacterium]|nr:RluA family pseudouridine synthase [Deltaproteobacteria bacterium]
MPASCGRFKAGCVTAFPTTDGERPNGIQRDAERLDRYLVRMGWASSRRAAVDLIARGCVQVNGQRYRKRATIAPGDNVEVIEGMAGETLSPNPDLKINVLFEDAAVIVADKPALMPCHPLRSDERDTVMNGIVAAYPETANAGDKPLEGGLIHRLDNGTSGALMIARNHDAFLAMREALTTGRVMRRYRALVAGRLEGTVEIATPIAHHHKNSRKMVVVDEGVDAMPEAIASMDSRRYTLGSSSPAVSKRYRSQPRPAFTKVEAISFANGFTVVEVTPRTGSRHQIRVHLASIGYPIAGDELYGGPPLTGLEHGRFWLHLAELEFESPASARVKVSALIASDLMNAKDRT